MWARSLTFDSLISRRRERRERRECQVPTVDRDQGSEGSMSRVVFLVVMVIAILAVADAQTKPKPKSTPKPTTPTATTVGAEAPLPRGSDLKEGASQAEKAAKVFGEIMGTPDKGIPTDLLNKAECVAVFPGVVKAGFIVGSKAGRGVASCRTPSGWSAPAFL